MESIEKKEEETEKINDKVFNDLKHSSEIKRKEDYYFYHLCHSIALFCSSCLVHFKTNNKLTIIDPITALLITLILMYLNSNVISDVFNLMTLR